MQGKGAGSVCALRGDRGAFPDAAGDPSRGATADVNSDFAGAVPSAINDQRKGGFRMNRGYYVAASVVLSFAIGCVMPQKQPPQVVQPNFSFSPPAPSGSRVDMTIALIKPGPSGSMFTEHVLADPNDMVRVRRYVDDMLEHAKEDMEKILVARGFNTLGPFDGIDEMTYSQKERSSLILTPLFAVRLEFVGGDVKEAGLGKVSQTGTVSMTGKVLLNFQEPMSKEKVDMKFFDLEPLSAPYTVSMRARNPQSGDVIAALLLGGANQPKNDQVEATVKVLNDFYQNAMTKISNLLDTREILQLRGETQKLKKLKRY
jgi:hypothetical protein